MPTTIQISDNTKKFLDRSKLFERETYDDIIERMIEDTLELNERTKKEIAESRREAKEGKVVSHEEVRRRYGL